MFYLYLGTGVGLLFVGGSVLLLQAYFWLMHQEWIPAPLSYFWELIGIAGPLGDLPMAGVFILFGGWFTWEAVKRGKRAAQSD